LQAKSQCSGANDGIAYGCRDPLEGIIVATLSTLELRVKTLDLYGFDNGGACCVVTSSGVLSWSSSLPRIEATSVASSMLLSFCYLSLICLYEEFLITLYQFGRLTLCIKRDESLFRGHGNIFFLHLGTGAYVHGAFHASGRCFPSCLATSIQFFWLTLNHTRTMLISGAREARVFLWGGGGRRERL
jgi:hypothetical protein